MIHTKKEPSLDGSFLFLLSFYKRQNFFHFSADIGIVLPEMRPQAMGTVLDSLLCITETAAAPIPKAVKRTVAKQTAEAFRIRTGMTGKILTFLMLKKLVVCHLDSPYLTFCGILFKRMTRAPSGVAQAQIPSASPFPDV